MAFGVQFDYTANQNDKIKFISTAQWNNKATDMKKLFHCYWLMEISCLSVGHYFCKFAHYYNNGLITVCKPAYLSHFHLNENSN